MRNAWDDFAEQNAEYYILTEDTDYSINGKTFLF